MTNADLVDCSSILYAWNYCQSEGQSGLNLVWLEFAFEVMALESF